MLESLLSITVTTNDAGALSPAAMQITVDLLAADDMPVEQKILPAAAPLTDKTTLKSTSTLELAGAEVMVINVNYPGYTSYSRRVAAEELVYLNAELQALEEVTVTLTQTESISGTMVNGFTVSLPAGGNEGDIQIGIPRSLLPEGTTSVTAEIKSFDPNDPVDAQNFPGDYADTDGNNLVSVAFNYADIRTDAGESLTTLSKTRAEARLGRLSLFAAEADAAAEPVIINRSIPASSCATLSRLGDANTTQTGFQIPVYSYDGSRGLWELLGYGSVYTAAGNLLDGVDEAECETEPYVLEIAVTSDIFLSNWWNLDYPLVFSQPVKYCAKIQLQNGAGQTLPGLYGFFYGNSTDFASNYFITDDSGQATLEVEAADVGDSLPANIAIFGETNYYSEATLSKNCVSPQVQILEATLPRLCQVRGKLQYPDGSPATRHPLIAVPATANALIYPDFAASDAAGEYWLTINCETDYEIYVYALEEEAQRAVNVNGTAGADEQSDNGEVVELASITVTPIPTTIYGSTYSTVDKAIRFYFLGHRDNFPVQYSLTIGNSSGETIGTVTGTVQALNEDEDEQFLWYFGFGQVEQALQLNTGSDVTLTLTGTLTDNRDQVTSVDSVVFVTNQPLDSIEEETE